MKWVQNNVLFGSYLCKPVCSKLSGIKSFIILFESVMLKCCTFFITITRYSLYSQLSLFTLRFETYRLLAKTINSLSY